MLGRIALVSAFSGVLGTTSSYVTPSYFDNGVCLSSTELVGEFWDSGHGTELQCCKTHISNNYVDEMRYGVCADGSSTDGVGLVNVVANVGRRRELSPRELYAMPDFSAYRLNPDETGYHHLNSPYTVICKETDTDYATCKDLCEKAAVSAIETALPSEAPLYGEDRMWVSAGCPYLPAECVTYTNGANLENAYVNKQNQVTDDPVCAKLEELNAFGLDKYGKRIICAAPIKNTGPYGERCPHDQYYRRGIYLAPEVETPACECDYVDNVNDAAGWTGNQWLVEAAHEILDPIKTVLGEIGSGELASGEQVLTEAVDVLLGQRLCMQITGPKGKHDHRRCYPPQKYNVGAGEAGALWGCRADQLPCIANIPKPMTTTTEEPF